MGRYKRKKKPQNSQDHEIDVQNQIFSFAFENYFQ